MGLKRLTGFTLAVLSLLAAACASAPPRIPTFVAPATLQNLRESLIGTGFFNDASFSAPADEDILTVDLRIGAALGEVHFEMACLEAKRVVNQTLKPDVRRHLRLIRDWQVAHTCW